MYIPDLPTYLVFYFETTGGSSIDTPTTDDDDDDTLLIFSSIQQWSKFSKVCNTDSYVTWKICMTIFETACS